MDRERIKLAVLLVLLIAVGGWLYTLIIPKRDAKKFTEAYLLQDNAKSEDDFKRAAELYRGLVAHGHYKAQNNLASLYQDGQGVEKDIDRAIELYRLSYQNGPSSWTNLPARNLGYIYYRNKYGRRDIDKAAKWFQIASDKNDRYASRALANIYIERDSEDIESYVKAGEAFAKARELGDGEVRTYLTNAASRCANSSYYSEKVTRDCAISAGAGNRMMQFRLYYAYKGSEALPQNNERELYWLRTSADNGYRPARCELAKLYEVGRLVEQDNVTAYAWASISSEAPLAVEGVMYKPSDEHITKLYNIIDSVAVRECAELKTRLLGKLTDSQIAEAKAFVDQYFKEHP